MDVNKKTLGKYYTKNNPFNHKLFYEWFELTEPGSKILEPFAGANNIVKQIKDLGFTNRWSCFDIAPSENNVCPEVPILKKDTISDFPTGYTICITNPPYLAKNSASRLHLEYPDTDYDDIYKLCLELMLYHCDYVAAIIPESFMTSGLFLNRLYGVISLTYKLFDDTECPVCLALFTPKDDVKIYAGDEYLGNFTHLRNHDLSEYDNLHKWTFNDPHGKIGVKCVDNQNSDDIYFHDGEDIRPEDIKVSSRAFTRISGLPEDISLARFLHMCNQELNEYRKNTKDVFMTSFKGLRKDGRYRRRIDFKTLKRIMNKTLKKLK